MMTFFKCFEEKTMIILEEDSKDFEKGYFALVKITYQSLKPIGASDRGSVRHLFLVPNSTLRAYEY